MDWKLVMWEVRLGLELKFGRLRYIVGRGQIVLVGDWSGWEGLARFGKIVNFRNLSKYTN